MHTRFANGAHYGAYAPLGYVKTRTKRSSSDRPGNTLDCREDFDLAVHGRGAASITRILVEEKYLPRLAEL